METQRLTGEDLDALGMTEGSDAQLLSTARRLVQAVDEDRIADPADIGYALSIAADLAHQRDDLATAIDLAERAVAADLVHVGTEYSRGLLAELLFADNREAEAFLQLEPLRALMTVDALAGRAAAEALEASGRAELAVDWLTEALTTAIEVGEAIPQEQEEALDHAAAVVYELVSLRHRIRGDLGREHDNYDELFDDLKAQIDELNHPGPVLFWPEQQFAALMARWPAQGELWGTDWDEHRTDVEAELQGWSESGTSGLSVLAADLTELLDFAEAKEADPTDEEVQLDYADSLPDDRQQPWPPPRNGPCWCGSRAKYKKCCLPRPRG